MDGEEQESTTTPAAQADAKDQGAEDTDKAVDLGYDGSSEKRDGGGLHSRERRGGGGGGGKAKYR